MSFTTTSAAALIHFYCKWACCHFEGSLTLCVVQISFISICGPTEPDAVRTEMKITAKSTKSFLLNMHFLFVLPHFNSICMKALKWWPFRQAEGDKRSRALLQQIRKYFMFYGPHMKKYTLPLFVRSHSQTKKSTVLSYMVTWFII